MFLFLVLNVNKLNVELNMLRNKLVWIVVLVTDSNNNMGGYTKISYVYLSKYQIQFWLLFSINYETIINCDWGKYYK